MTVETDGQVQLKCRVVAQVLPDQYVIVTGRSNDMLESIDTAIDKLARSIERVVDKQNEQKRETWPPNDWAPSNRAEPPVAWSVHFPAE